MVRNVRPLVTRVNAPPALGRTAILTFVCGVRGDSMSQDVHSAAASASGAGGETILTNTIEATNPIPSSITANNKHPASAHLKFNGSDRFIRELRKRVDAYFEKTGHRRRDCPQMYFKTATIVAWFLGAYLLLLLAVHTWWLVVPLAAV